MDYFPTIQDYLSFKTPRNWPIDAISPKPLIESNMNKRTKPIPFCSFWFSKKAMHGSPTLALIDSNLKFFTNLSKDGSEDLLYGLVKDPSEKNNIIKDYPERAAEMKETLKKWLVSCKASHAGKDYDTPFTPVNRFPIVTDDGLRR